MPSTDPTLPVNRAQKPLIEHHSSKNTASAQPFRALLKEMSYDSLQRCHGAGGWKN